MNKETRQTDAERDAENNSAQRENVTASRNLMDDVMISLMVKATAPEQLEARSGQIHRMSVPVSWEAGPDYKNRMHGASYEEYHPAGDSDCQLGFYYRGKKVSPAAANEFHRLLGSTSHQLDQTELRSLREVLRDKSNPADFDISRAYTEDLNGKRVLIVEGRYKANQNQSKHLFIDADGTGSAVQEVFFQAPKDKFSKYSAAADEALKTIRWK